MENTNMAWADTERAFSELYKLPEGKKYVSRLQEDTGDLIRDVIQHWKKSNADIYRVFEGSTRTDLRCRDCGVTKNHWDTF